MAMLEALDGQRVLGADVDVALVRADGVGADDHAFEHRVRVAFEHGAVHERAGVAFVARCRGRTCVVALARGRKLPFQAGREAGAAAAAQAGGLHLVDDLLGRHRGRAPWRRPGSRRGRCTRRSCWGSMMPQLRRTILTWWLKNGMSFISGTGVRSVGRRDTRRSTMRPLMRCSSTISRHVFGA